jgi:hypothetical protein
VEIYAAGYDQWEGLGDSRQKAIDEALYEPCGTIPDELAAKAKDLLATLISQHRSKVPPQAWHWTRRVEVTVYNRQHPSYGEEVKLLATGLA